MPADALPDAWATPAAPAKPPKPASTDGELPPIELPQSKALARLRYDPAQQSLVAEFRNGSVYRYFGISRDDYTVLATSASPGARFNTNIAPYHEFERLASRPLALRRLPIGALSGASCVDLEALRGLMV